MEQSQNKLKTGLYGWFARNRWPRNYADKFYVLAFAILEMPIIAAIITFWLVPESRSFQLAVAFAIANLVASVLIFKGLGDLLRPIMAAAEATKAYRLRGELPQLPMQLEDEAGEILRSVDQAIYFVHRAQTVGDDETVLASHRRQLEQSMSLFMEMGLPLYLARVRLQPEPNFSKEAQHDRLEACIVVARSVLRATDWVMRWDEESLIVMLATPNHGADVALEKLRNAISNSGAHLNVGYTQVRDGDTLDYVLDRAQRAVESAWKQNTERAELV